MELGEDGDGGEQAQEEEVLIKLFVRDDDAGTAQEEFNVSPKQTIRDIKKMYSDKTKRPLINPTLKRGEESLSDESTVDQTGLVDDETLTFTNDACMVAIREGSDSKESKAAAKDERKLRVFDWWTVALLKQHYSKERPDQGLVEGDQILKDNELLDESKMLFQYGVVDGTVLTVQREDISQVVNKYICAGACAAGGVLPWRARVRIALTLSFSFQTAAPRCG
jgi:hypothetical protein